MNEMPKAGMADRWAAILTHDSSFATPDSPAPSLHHVGR